MRRSPLISIVTVVKDDRAGLAQTRQCLGNQTFRNFEWLIADGGSRDGSAELAESSRRAGEATWVDSVRDGGPYAAMNRALPVARGDYLLFLNAGDRLADADVLALLGPVLTTGAPPDLVFGDAIEQGASGGFHRKSCRAPEWIAYGMPTHHCAMLFRREALGGRRFREDFWIAADYALTAEMIVAGATVIRYRHPVAIFAPGGLSRRHQDVGRLQQGIVRRHILGINPALNSLIDVAQRCAESARKRLPKIYDILRYASGLKVVLSKDQGMTCSSARHPDEHHNHAP